MTPYRIRKGMLSSKESHCWRQKKGKTNFMVEQTFLFEEVWLMYNEEAHCRLGRALSRRACVMLKFSCPALKNIHFIPS